MKETSKKFAERYEIFCTIEERGENSPHKREAKSKGKLYVPSDLKFS